AGVALEQLDAAAGVELLAVTADQLRLVVEGIDLAGGAGHEQLHDAPGPGAVVQAAIEVRARRGPRPVREQALPAEQMGQGDAAEPAPGSPEESAAVDSRLFHGSPGLPTTRHQQGATRKHA